MRVRAVACVCSWGLASNPSAAKLENSSSVRPCLHMIISSACTIVRVCVIIIIDEMTIFNVAGCLIEERRRCPVMYCFPTRTVFQINLRVCLTRLMPTCCSSGLCIRHPARTASRRNALYATHVLCDCFTEGSTEQQSAAGALPQQHDTYTETGTLGTTPLTSLSTTLDIYSTPTVFE